MLTNILLTAILAGVFGGMFLLTRDTEKKRPEIGAREAWLKAMRMVKGKATRLCNNHLAKQSRNKGDFFLVDNQNCSQCKNDRS